MIQSDKSEFYNMNIKNYFDKSVNFVFRRIAELVSNKEDGPFKDELIAGVISKDFQFSLFLYYLFFFLIIQKTYINYFIYY